MGLPDVPILNRLREPRRALLALIVAGFVVRCCCHLLEVETHPDEMYQYLDPAVFHLRGVGWQAWEWRDGIRSWVLPAYDGAWLVLGGWLGLRPGLPQLVLVQLQWALLGSLVWVLLGAWGASRLSLLMRRPTSGPIPRDPHDTWTPALWGAAALAFYPPLVVYGPRTLSEVPSAMLLMFAMVATAHVVVGTRAERSWSTLIGLTAAAGACVRIVNGPLALVPVLWLAQQRKWRCVPFVALGAVPAVALFGVVDWLTWGAPFASLVKYVRFNFIEGRAAEFGVAPRWWYLRQVWDRAGAGLLVLLGLAAARWRATWPFLLTGLGTVLYLSTQAHKEERFLLVLWPALLIPAAVEASAWVRRLQGADRRLHLLTAMLGLFVYLDGWGGIGRLEWHTHGAHLRKAQGFVAAKDDVTGVIVDEFFDSGAYAAFGRNLPMVRFDRAMLPNPLFNYAIVSEDEDSQKAAAEAGFVELARWGRVIAARRPDR